MTRTVGEAAATGDRRGCPGRAWVAVATGLAFCAIAGQALPREVIDWQPDLGWREPWRSITAVGVHYSRLHLGGNLAGAALAGLLGWAAQLPRRAALAWLVAWPLTQWGLLLRPDLSHYGGLSGVLHAGVAIVAVWLLATGTTRAQRRVGLAIGVGLVIKAVSESPWGPPLRQLPDWDIQTAPLAHLSGVAAGTLTAVCGLLLQKRRDRRHAEITFERKEG